MLDTSECVDSRRLWGKEDRGLLRGSAGGGIDKEVSTGTSIVPTGSAWRLFLLPILPAMLLEIEEDESLWDASLVLKLPRLFGLDSILGSNF